MVSAGPTGVNGEDDGEVESARGEEGLHETAEKSPPAAVAERTAGRRKCDMAEARGGKEVCVVALCASWDRCLTAEHGRAPPQRPHGGAPLQLRRRPSLTPPSPPRSQLAPHLDLQPGELKEDA